MRKFRLLTLITLVVFAFQACEQKVSISFHNDNSEPVFLYAKAELKQFINEDYLSQAKNAGIKSVAFDFQVKPELNDATFKVLSKLDGNSLKVNLSGQSPSDVLYAAYTFLEKGGYLFEITGSVKPQKFKWETLKGYTETIEAAVKRRGIRQHINFTMDVSAWPVEEAKSYIQNLSRMRFNYMTFHSYPGQWYEVIRKDTTEYAGHFFYGDVHTIPEQQDIKAIVENEKYFCIPEIEPAFEDKIEKSKKAIEWLGNVINEAKRTGMQVQFSIEPRNADTNIEKSVETVKAILKQYPMIDALEFITEEAGGWGPRTTEEHTKEVIVSHFGEQYLHDTIVMKPVRKEQSDLAYNYGQIGHNSKLIKSLRNNKIIPDNIELKLGIYVAIPEYARPSFYLARQMLPETEIAIMPGHHSSRVNNNTPIVLKNTEDWDKAIIYSWIEFDGMMYLQQNGISGIQSIVNQVKDNTSDHRANAILYNHWRTAENKITARYAAVSGLYGGIEPSAFYKKYAEAYGIKSTDEFALAMKMLDEVDIFGTNNLGNFGFCWVGRWRHGFPVNGYTEDNLKKVRQGFEKVLEQLKLCSQDLENENGHSLLVFLDNRIRATIIYIKAFEKAWGMDHFDTGKPLSQKEKDEYVKICNECLALFDQYINLYAQINADRGCVGNLVSLWHGPVKGLKILRKRHGGIPFEDKIPENTAVDAPPLPIINKN